MGIRNKIILYFSFTTILLTGVAMLFIFALFSEYREEEFQQRQKEKIKSTLFFLTEIKRADSELAETIDRLTINDLYNEKLLIFNDKKQLIYSSIDDTKINYPKAILKEISSTNVWYESKEELYDIVGLYFESDGSSYYGISKAYDKFGYLKLDYLRYILFATFLIISVVVILIAYFLSKRITLPLLTITEKISGYSFEGENNLVHFEQPKNEIAILAQQFNKLMKRMNEAFSFQKHAVHHISHELKTPIAILVSNFERTENETDLKNLHDLIKKQKEDTKSLGDIINSLLEIAKAETGNSLMNDVIRIDELIFDVSDELRHIHSGFQFLIEYTQTKEENNLMLTGNTRLLKAALMNLMLNCIQYSEDKKAKISIGNKEGNVEVVFQNNGPVITGCETQFLFQHFFRGGNSMYKSGFGLGLVFVFKIMVLHGGTISYHSIRDSSNVFTISLPVS